MSTLFEATDNWALNKDRGFVNAVVFLDLKKAFDIDNHSTCILLWKLDLYEIKGNAHVLICSYLYNCTKKCSVNGLLSKRRSLTLHAVFPKGTILGPLLFLSYVNDLQLTVCLILNQECLLTTLI